MITVEIETVIERPIDEVFGCLVDISGYSTWMPGNGLFLESGGESDIPVRKGTTYYDKTRMGTFQGEIVEYRKPLKVVFLQKLYWFGRVVMISKPAYSLREMNGKTRLYHLGQAEGNLGLMQLLQPLFKKIAYGERKRTVMSLKKKLETG